MDVVICTTPAGKRMHVSREKLVFRPSVYGLVIHEKELLVTISRTTGLYKLPGGGIHLGEGMEDALKRELREECGIEIQIDDFAFFKEDFFYFEEDLAWHSHLFFFFCSTMDVTVTDRNNELEDESRAPCWVDVASLKLVDFQFAGKEIVSVLSQILNSSV